MRPRLRLLEPNFLRQIPKLSNRKSLDTEKSREETSHSGLVVVDVKDTGNIEVAMALLVVEVQVVQVVVD